MKPTKSIVKNYVKYQLSTNPAWTLKGLTQIYARQTSDEQASGTTNNLNNIGFTGADAEILSSFAIQYQNHGGLSHKQMSILFKKMPKYASQLISLIPSEKLENVKSNAVKYYHSLPSPPKIN